MLQCCIVVVATIFSNLDCLLRFSGGSYATIKELFSEILSNYCRSHLEELSSKFLAGMGSPMCHTRAEERPKK